MAFELSNLLWAHYFTLEIKALGRVHCGTVSVNVGSQLNKALKLPNVDGLFFARRMLSLVATKTLPGDAQEDSLAQKEEFTVEDINRVTEEELEAFAQEFVFHNRWLLQTYKGGGRQVKTNEEGEVVVSSSRKIVDCPKEDAETSTNYLLRLYRHYSVEKNKQLKTVMETSTYNSTAAMQKILARNQDLMRTIDPYLDLRRHLEENSASMALTISYKREQDQMLATARQYEEVRRQFEAFTESTKLAKAIYHDQQIASETARNFAHSMSAVSEKRQQEVCDLLRSHEALFRLPQAFEMPRLIDVYENGSVSKLVQQHAKHLLDQKQILDAMRTPWLHIVEETQSVSAIFELQGIGNALKTMKGFDPKFTAALRQDLGDWRDKISFSESVFIDPVARTDFYVTRGFNASLTDFPEAAFHQCLDLVGLGEASLDIELYGIAALPSTDQAEEDGLQRTNRCHDRLQRFERQLRQFIDIEMTTQYGSNWPKKRLPPSLFEAWEFKKQRAESSSGMILSFIDVADFTDYEMIICKQDHWREVFGTRFHKKESVRESLQRLQPIRLSAMHARIVTKEDELYLVAEILRLSRAIK